MALSINGVEITEALELPSGRYANLWSGSELRLFNTTDRVTNYERLRAWFASNVGYIGFDKGGTGTQRALRIQNMSTSYIQFGTAGGINIVTTANLTLDTGISALLFNTSHDTACPAWRDTNNDYIGSFKPKVYVKAYNSDLFNAAALTDSVAIFTQPATSTLLFAKILLKTQFAAPAITDLTVTLGETADEDGILTATGNLITDAAATAYTARGAYWNTAQQGGGRYEPAARAWTAYATAVGANLNTLTAGSITFFFMTVE